MGAVASPGKVALRIYNPAVELLSRDQLLALQWKKLQQQLEWAYGHSPFYRGKLDVAGIAPDSIKSLDDFRRVPLTNKAELVADQEEHPPFGDRYTIPKEDVVRYYHTSGTSGLGQEIHALSRRDVEYTATFAYGWHWAGIVPGDMYVATLPVGLGNLAGPDSSLQSAVRARLNILNLGPYPAEQKLAMMKRFGADLIFIVPAYVQRLYEAAKTTDFNLRSLGVKNIMVAAEPYPLDWVGFMEEQWGATFSEMYGSTQLLTGGAYTCELGVAPDGRRGVLHVLEHLNHVDIVDPATGEPVADGEEGELILTPLEREAMPLLRFATGDRVRRVAAGSCPCGRPFAGFVAGEIGRYDDMMKIKVVNVWPQAVDEVVFAYREVVEYQGVVRELASGTDVCVTVEFHADVTEELRRKCLAALGPDLREKIGVSMRVEEAAERLPRFEFKVRRWTDERTKGLQRVLYTEKKGS